MNPILFKTDTFFIFRFLPALGIVLCMACADTHNKTEDPTATKSETKISYHNAYLSEIAALPQRPQSKVDTLDMVQIPGGNYLMGGLSTQSRPDEKPRHEETVVTFRMDKNEVSNAEFSKFIEATGYVTTAEREILLEGKTYPPGALVFDETDPQAWWRFQEGATWRHPKGPQSDIVEKESHPVVQVSWYDAMAYAHWARKRLPTEAEWEYAARGGKTGTVYFWGDDFGEATQHANFHQGNFPTSNTLADGFERTAPTGKFPENGYGLNDMAGNVWEWCLDTYYPDAYSQLEKRENGYFKAFYNSEQQKVVRGGSFLCSESYCTGYRAAARMSSTPDTGLEHTGFRCVM